MRLRDVYRQMAKAHGVTVKEVKDKIKRSINEAWSNPERSDIIRVNQNKVPCRSAIPTPNELLCYLVGRAGGGKV